MGSNSIVLFSLWDEFAGFEIFEDLLCGNPEDRGVPSGVLELINVITLHKGNGGKEGML
jgi:hypothetical protein